ARSTELSRCQRAVAWPFVRILAWGAPCPTEFPGSTSFSPARYAPRPTPGASATSSSSAVRSPGASGCGAGLGPEQATTTACGPVFGAPASATPLNNQPDGI